MRSVNNNALDTISAAATAIASARTQASVQAALGEGKKGKGNDIVPLQVNINGKKLVLGSLSAGKFPQVSFDLVFEKEFELSHDWKDGRVYFCGYSADNQFDEDVEDEFALILAYTGQASFLRKHN
ncbi:histone deacetylase HDT1-like isoform X1 [Camellia sinensis]|uniref:histone deacetylase HDT1-like isoform X1 n=1 Tax=Camellia sinensis TaxID=4442 RepID=UPI001036D4F2|nr:histone deacetylase HDT1-like isoform X1 [Camellia sinensis]XP_028105695.1 histone deacetylase HDT1-like isoform X1 [Camellia sinensis]